MNLKNYTIDLMHNRLFENRKIIIMLEKSSKMQLKIQL